jgi:hypothetical protein
MTIFYFMLNNLLTRNSPFIIKTIWKNSAFKINKWKIRIHILWWANSKRVTELRFRYIENRRLGFSKFLFASAWNHGGTSSLRKQDSAQQSIMVIYLFLFKFLPFFVLILHVFLLIFVAVVKKIIVTIVLNTDPD